MKQRIKRPLALLLTVVMVLGMLPTAAFAAEDDGLCEHHPEHTEACGYREAVAGSPCGHEHDETCGYTLGTEEVPCDKGCMDDDGDGIIVHADGCSYQPAVEGTPCTHEHDENCGYAEAVEGQPCQYVCEICAAQNGDADQTPADNGGNLPDAQDGVNETKITVMTLENFKPFKGTKAEDVDLLTQTEPLEWNAYDPGYTLSFQVSLQAGVEQSMDIALPYGMQYVGLVEDSDGTVSLDSASIESATWERSDAVYDEHQRDNGTLHIQFVEQGWTSSSFKIVVRPDEAFLPTELKTNGYLIDGAIKAETYANDELSDSVTVSAKLFSTNSVVSSNGGWEIQKAASAGSSITVTPTVYWQYFSPAGGGQTYRFIDKAELIFAVPQSLTLTKAYLQGMETEGYKEVTDLDSQFTAKYPDCNFYSVSRENFYGAYQGLYITVTIPDTAKEDEIYTISPVCSTVTSFNNSSTNLFTFTTDRDKINITVVDPEKVNLEVSADPVYLSNYTYLGNQNHNFDDYNMILSYAKIENKSVTSSNEDLIYEAQFDESDDLIRTAIRIPCPSSDKYPTSVTLFYKSDLGVEGQITLDEDDVQAIARGLDRGAGQGVEILLEDTELPSDAQITGVKAVIPSLSMSYRNSNGYHETYTSSVLGRIATGVTGERSYTDKYRIYPATTPEGEIPDYTEVSISLSNSAPLLGSYNSTKPTVLVNGQSSTKAAPGDTIQITEIPVFPTDYYGAPKNMLAIDPVFYVVEPEGLNLRSVSFTDEDGNPIYYRSEEVIPSNNTSVAYSGKLWAYQLNDTLSGWFDGDMEARKVYAEVEYTAPYGVQTQNYDVSELMFWKSGIEGTTFSGSFPYKIDSYGLNSGKYMGGYQTLSFVVNAPVELTISSAIQIEGTDEWFQYDGTESSLAVFGTDTQASVRVTVRNNSEETVSAVEVYVPIPKKGLNLGEGFGDGTPYEFDMYVAGQAEVASNWSVTYGVVSKPDDLDTAPTPASQWSTAFSNETNMVKITMLEGGSLAPGESAEITLKLKASGERSQSDSTNLFKSWWTCETSSGTNYDATKNINFGALLQIGELTGTVYADANRNGIKNETEAGIAGVTVEVKDENGRVYRTMTDETGAYSMEGLPGNQNLTVTVYNPKSPNPNNSNGSYRFSRENASDEGTIGSDVIPASDNGSASKDGFTLTEGKGTVNAGLIEPYTATFLVGGGESNTSYVTPSSLNLYAGQTLGDVTDRVTVTLAPGVTFEDKWTVLPAEGQSTEVEHSALLEQTLNADTTFTAVTSTTENIVTAMWWDTETETVTQQFSLKVEWNRPVGNTFPDDAKVNNRPGYNFIGWSVNGTAELKQRNEIINAQVTGAVNYIAQYTEKSDITVTLNANGGTFAGGQGTAEKAGQTFGTAVEYETPTREGYTFQGWSTDQDATEGTMSLTCPADDANYFAVWKPGTVRLTLMANGGTWADSSSYKSGYIDGTVGENVTLPTATDITREGYTFLGWYVQGDTDQEELTGYKFPATATTLIAKWEPREETITFTYGEASQIQAETVSGKHGSTVGYEKGQELSSKTYAGYTLTGWTAPDGTVVPAANTGSILIEGGKTYTAIWEQNQTSLVFNAGDGASFPNNGQTKTFYGSAGESLHAGDLIDPVMEGKTFVGWFTQATGGDQVETFTFPENGSTTYYAHWEDATYTVTFNYNGGKVGEATSSTVTVTHGQSVESVPVPTLGGSTLEGWQNLTTGETLKADAIKEATVTADVIYNAVWSGNSYTVTFSNYDGNPDSKATVTVTEGAAPVAPVVKAPDGKVFLHWSDNATQNTYTAEQLTELNVTKDMDFTAVFGEDSYTITFITSNGSFKDMGGATQITVTKQGGQTLVASDFPTVTGNTANFTGWYYNGTTKTAEEWGKSNITVNSNMTFVAAFEGKVTVSFNTMGGTWTTDGQQYANGIEGNAGEAMTLPTAQHIERTGWTFAGWYTDMNFSTPAPEVFPGSRATYYAKWTTDGLTVTVEETPTYDGTAKTPALTVKSGTTALGEGQYVANYSSNTNAGTATVTVYGLGDYLGLTGTATFTIQKADQAVTFAKSGDQTATYGESYTNPATSALDSANATITYSSSDESIAEVDTDGNVTIKKAGTVTITAKSAETSNVNAGTESYTLTISKANPTLRFDNAAVSVKATETVENNLTIVPSGLTVTYTSNNTSVATVDPSTGAVTLVGEGTTTITATFAGNDQYNEATANYTLTVDNSAIAYTAEGWYGTYDGQDHGITVTVTEPGTGATVTYSETADGTYTTTPITKTDAGEYTVYYKIEAEKYDTVTGSARIIINKATLTEATVTGGEYTGSPVNATISEVKAGSLTVPTGSYGVNYLNNVNASETAVAIITANADSNFDGTLVKSFTISPKQLTEDMVSPIPDQPYTGQQIQPAVIVTDSDISKSLTLGEDYTVSYGDNNTVGTGKGTVTITGKGNYEGTVTKNFNITNSGTFEVIVGNTTLTYDGTEQEPTVTVWAVSQDGKTKTQLTAGTDYTLTYADNTNAGTASVTVTGQSAYVASGDSWKTTTAYFTIGKAEQEVSFAGVSDNSVSKTYGDSAFTEAATVKLNPDVSGQQAGEITYKTSDATVATVDSTTGEVTIVGAGTATITATAAATDNYNGASASYTLTVNPKDIGSEDVTVSKIADQPYEGLPVTPSFTVTDSDPDLAKHNLAVNVDYTYAYDNNTGVGEGKITLTGTGNYTGTKEVTFQIVSLQEFTITAAPAPITIYMGGQTGFDQVVVDEDTGEIQASKSLPVPGFLFTLPDALTEALEANGDSATDLIFQERGGTKQWSVVLYNESATNLYRLVAAAGQDPVRVQFTNAQGTTVPEDHFIVGENVNQELTMSIYRGQVGDIVVIYDGVIYPVKTGEATLTVRGTTSAPQLPTVIAEDDFGLETLEAGKAAVTAPAGTTYAINGGDVQVTDTTGVSLLFDGIINSSGNNRTEQLEARAEAYFNDPDDSQAPQEGYQYAYAFQYLDLVDTNNGNAWVKASNDVTVYWPIPADADRSTLQVLHFEGLHRDMATGEIETEISTATVTEVENVTIEGDYVTFEIGSAGFSPFALVWQTKIPYTITATAGGNNGSITPSGNVTVLYGDSQTFTITPNSSYRISDVLVDGVSVGAVSTYTFNDVAADHTIHAVFAYNGGGGSSSGGNGGGGSDHEDEEPSEFPDISDPSDTGVADLLNTTDHIAFLGGYGGGKFGPNDNMTRAQAAQMFYNLLIDQDVPITVNFTDVPADAWYAEAVNTLGSLGIIAGVGNDQFAPDRSITRAEFTVIAMRFTNLGLGGENPFIDVPDDAWYYDYVVRAAQYGWIGGYSDGTFRPYNTITRAEVTAIVNRMLGRSADEDYVDAHRNELTQFTDVPTNYWAYYQIMEATNAHDYIMNDTENWTRLH